MGTIELFVWCLALLVTVRLLFLLCQRRVLRATAEAAAAWMVSFIAINSLLGFEGIGPGCIGCERRAAVPSNATFRYPGAFGASSCLYGFASAEELLTAIRRTDICTLVVLGAPWDAHYKKWTSGGAWQEMADVSCADSGIEVGYFHYSGASGQEGSIPLELGLGPTLGSYSPRAWRAGVDLGELQSVRGWGAEQLRERLGEGWATSTIEEVCKNLTANYVR